MLAGVVVLPEGANAYVNMKGRLWKCANEHLRDGTSEEIRGVGHGAALQEGGPGAPGGHRLNQRPVATRSGET